MSCKEKSKIGAMRHKIIIQSREKTNNSVGKQVENWTDFYECFAKIEAISDRAFIEANAEQSFLTHNITIRFKQGITPSMRIKFRSRTFIIQTVVNVEEKNRYLKMRCLEVFKDVI